MARLGSGLGIPTGDPLHTTGPHARPRPHPTDRPLACSPSKSYRLPSAYGWVMIAASDDADALREARRSTDRPRLADLQRWDGIQYQHCEVHPLNLACAAQMH